MTTRIFLSNEARYAGIRGDIKAASSALSKGEYYLVDGWSCSKVGIVEVGDEVYFKRVGNSPLGYFAHGKVVSAVEENQLRLEDQQWENLSSAYCDYDGEDFYVAIEWDSYVDYDSPLETSSLKENPKFAGAFFDPQGSGYAFREEYTGLLAKAWENHSRRLAKKARGFRLDDRCYELAKDDYGSGLYENAISKYSRAIQANLNHAKSYIGRGDTYRKIQDYRNAEKDYTSASEIKSPLIPVASYRRGMLYAEMGDSQLGLLDLDKAAELFSIQGNQNNYQRVLKEKDRLSGVKLKLEINVSADEIEHTSEPNQPLSELLKKADSLDTSFDVEVFIDENPGTEIALPEEGREDTRERLIASVVQRPGQSEFRRKLLTAYGGQCAITGCDVEQALEAAHITPYFGIESDHTTNGLPLRADLHKLFDAHLLSIDPESFRVYVSPILQNSYYKTLHGTYLYLPEDDEYMPSKDALRNHWKLCVWTNR
jgi:HNH endonuclease/Tetratricopeptide repeat